MHQCSLYICIYIVIISRAVTTMIGNRWLQEFLDPTKNTRNKIVNLNSNLLIMQIPLFYMSVELRSVLSIISIKTIKNLVIS